MREGFYFRSVNITGNIFCLRFLGKNNRYIENFSCNTGNSDSGCLYRQDFRDFFSRKATPKLFSDLPEQIHVHLMI